MTPRFAWIATGLLLSGTVLDPRAVRAADPGPTVTSSSGRGPGAPLPVGLESVPAAKREMVRKVMQSPTLTARAPVEEFTAHGPLYDWMLDHPDRVAVAWRRTGVACVDITAKGGGKFGYDDGQGNQVVWETLAGNADGRVWYAEGHAKPGVLLPTIPVRAVAVLRHTCQTDAEGRSVIRHTVELFLQTDSKAATLVARMLGPTAPRLAEQGAEQLLLFFSSMAHYLEGHPERSDILYANRPAVKQ